MRGNSLRGRIAQSFVSHYESQTTIRAGADEIFAFVKDPENMPQYLPTVEGAHGQGQGRVEVEGDAAGHHYKSDGWFKVDDAERTMSWGSDGEHKYTGRLDVRPLEGQSQISVSLDFEPNPGEEKAFEAQMGSRDATIENGLRAALESIKNRFEGGSKVGTPAG